MKVTVTVEPVQATQTLTLDLLSLGMTAAEWNKLPLRDREQIIKNQYRKREDIFDIQIVELSIPHK